MCLPLAWFRRERATRHKPVLPTYRNCFVVLVLQQYISYETFNVGNVGDAASLFLLIHRSQESWVSGQAWLFASFGLYFDAIPRLESLVSSLDAFLCSDGSGWPTGLPSSGMFLIHGYELYTRTRFVALLLAAVYLLPKLAPFVEMIACHYEY